MTQAPLSRMLDVVHPARFAGMPPALTARALASRRGRRFLYARARRLAPDVFRPDADTWNVWLSSAPWLAWPRTQLHAFAHVLGVVALGPVLRVVLQRDRVLFLRRVAGDEVWHTMQTHDAWDGSPPESVRHMGAALLRRCGEDASSLRDAIHRRGSIEFIGHAERDNALLAQRLRMSFMDAPPEADDRQCWLSSRVVGTLLSEQHMAWMQARAEAHAAEADGDAGRTEADA